MKKELQLGNFKITREKMSFDWIKIEVVSGIWNTKFRSDNPYYRILDEMVNNEEAHTHLHNTIIMMFLISNGLKDNQFIEEVFNAVNSFIERTKEKPISEEEYQNIINEEKEKYDTNNEIQRGADSLDA